MNRRNLLAAAVMAALAGCSGQPTADNKPPEGPPPPGAKLVVLNLPGMT